MGALDLELEPAAASAWEERAESRHVVKDAATTAATSPRAALAARNAQMRELKPSSPVVLHEDGEEAMVEHDFVGPDVGLVGGVDAAGKEALSSPRLTSSDVVVDLPAGPVSSTVVAPKRLLDSSLAAIKRTLIPGLILQMVALFIILLYYLSPGARSGFDDLADLKVRGGFLFSGLSTMIVGALIPTLTSWAREDWAAYKKKRAQEMAQGLDLTTTAGGAAAAPEQQARAGDDANCAIALSSDDLPISDDPASVAVQFHDGADNSASSSSVAGGVVTIAHGPSRAQVFIVNVLYWTQHGMEVDLWFRFQGVIWGDGTDAGTIVAKTIIDQFIYSPFWCVPISLMVFRWRDNGFQFGPILAMLRTRSFWTFDCPSTLLGSWMVWMPAVVLIYCLPATLQVPLFVLVSCFWSLLLQLLAAK